MNKEKTRLQIVKEQMNEKMTREIVKAIKNGAKYKTNTDGGLYIDGVYLTPKFTSDYHGVILDIYAPEIEQLLEPTEEDLKKRAEKLRAQLNEIENKLKPNEQ